MSPKFTLGDVRQNNAHLDVSPSQSSKGMKADDQETFRILILGDFSGRCSRNLQESGSKNGRSHPIRVDRDNLDEVMEQIGPKISGVLATSSEQQDVLRFSRFEDFHPDSLYARLPAFAQLRDLRSRLEEPSTFDAAAGEVRSWSDDSGSPAPKGTREGSQEKSHSENVAASSYSLDDILELSQSDSSPKSTHPSFPINPLNDLIRELVGPHLVSIPKPEVSQLVACVDTVANELMRSLLHNHYFRQLEANWRGVKFLTARLETGESLKIFLLDISHTELAVDFQKSDNIESTALHHWLVEQTILTPGGEGWSLVVELNQFSASLADTGFLAWVSEIAATAGCPYIAAADPNLLGCDSFHNFPDPDDWNLTISNDIAEAWGLLRGLPEASYVGLSAPRFLLRLPHGKDTDPLETLPLEEITDPGSHEDFLWGNSAILVATLLGESFTHSGWNMRLGDTNDVSGLPLFVYQQHGQSELLPCAEALLSMRAAENMLTAGIMPVLSVRGDDTVKLGRFQSIADPLTPLAGPWQ